MDQLRDGSGLKSTPWTIQSVILLSTRLGSSTDHSGHPAPSEISTNRMEKSGLPFRSWNDSDVAFVELADMGLRTGSRICHALAIGACTTPTDPVPSNSIVKGKFADKHLPKTLQDLIIAEPS